MKDVFSVKDIPKLLVLDLAGNAVCESSLYRLSVIFHRQSLKVR
jgi:hypothetical protein